MDGSQDGAGGGDAGARAEFEGRLLADCGLSGTVGLRGAYEGGRPPGGATIPTPYPALTGSKWSIPVLWSRMGLVP